MTDNYGKFDVNYRLLRDRIIFLDGPIYDRNACGIVKQLLLLDEESPTEDIKLFINSPGGNVYEGLMIIDTINMIRSDVQTIVLGSAMSMGAVIASCGTKGKRLATKNSTFMIHQVLGGMIGQTSDLEIEVTESKRLKNLLNQMLADNAGKKHRQVEKDTDRNKYLTAIEALEWGLIDKIIE